LVEIKLILTLKFLPFFIIIFNLNCNVFVSVNSFTNIRKSHDENLFVGICWSNFERAISSSERSGATNRKVKVSIAIEEVGGARIKSLINFQPVFFSKLTTCSVFIYLLQDERV